MKLKDDSDKGKVNDDGCTGWLLFLAAVLTAILAINFYDYGTKPGTPVDIDKKPIKDVNSFPIPPPLEESKAEQLIQSFVAQHLKSYKDYIYFKASDVLLI